MQGGGGQKTQYVTQSVSKDPWAPQQAHLTNAMDRAKSWLESDSPEFYPDSTVTPFSPQTEEALRRTENAALDGSQMVTDAQGAVGNAASGQWVGSSPANQFFNGSLNFNNLATGLAQTNANNLQGASNPARQMLEATARGDYVGANNPHLTGAIEAATRPMVDQWRNDVAPAIDGGFSRGGRLGSGAYANARNRAEDTLGRNLAETASTIGYNDYARERGNQLSAQQNIGAFAQQDTQNALAAQQALASVSSAEESQRQAAAGALDTGYGRDRAQQLQGVSAVPAMREMDFYDSSKLAGVGAARESLAQAQLGDQMTRFNFDQNKEMDKIGKYLSIVGGGYGSEGTSVQPTFYNPASNFLGGAMAGAAIGKMAGFNPLYGAVGGGLLGGMG